MRDIGAVNRDFDGDIVSARFEPSERMRAYKSMSHTSAQAHQWQERLKPHILKLGRICPELVVGTRFSGTKHKKVLKEPKVDGRSRATSVQGGVKHRGVEIEQIW